MSDPTPVPIKTSSTIGAEMRIEVKLERSLGDILPPRPPAPSSWQKLLGFFVGALLCGGVFLLVLHWELLFRIAGFVVVMGIGISLLLGILVVLIWPTLLLWGTFESFVRWLRKPLEGVDHDPDAVWIKPRSFLLTMLSIAWCSLRHPLSVTMIDPTTGRFVEDN